MARFRTLASSSSGNCTYISASGGTLLVDVGISFRRLTQSLCELDAHPRQLAAVLITHEHIDHVRGLRQLTEKTDITVCASGAVLEYLLDYNHLAAKTSLIEVNGATFCVGDMEVTAFHTSHDSVDSVGYRIVTPDGHRIAVATDLGVVTDEVDRGVTGCELVMLEANYDDTMLWNGSYPYPLKRRIASALGHLPNDQTAAWACRLLGLGTTRLMLAHLSRENNRPALAFDTVDGALRQTGALAGVDYQLDVAPYDDAGRLVML